MNKLTLIWDPLYGDSVPDGKVSWKVDSLLYYLQYRSVSYNFGNNSFLKEISKRINDGRLDSESVDLVVDGRTYKVSYYVELPGGLNE